MHFGSQLSAHNFNFNTGAAAYSYALFGQGTGPILYNSVHCTGNENVLQECSHTISYYYCSHYNDAGVSCQPLGQITFLCIVDTIHEQTILQIIVQLVRSD